MKNLNHNLEEMTAINIVQWEFCWTDFVKEDWDKNQLFIVVYQDGEKALITYGDFMDSPHLCRVGAKSYRAINLPGV